MVSDSAVTLLPCSRRSRSRTSWALSAGRRTATSRPRMGSQPSAWTHAAHSCIRPGLRSPASLASTSSRSPSMSVHRQPASIVADQDFGVRRLHERDPRWIRVGAVAHPQLSGLGVEAPEAFTAGVIGDFHVHWSQRGQAQRKVDPGRRPLGTGPANHTGVDHHDIVSRPAFGAECPLAPSHLGHQTGEERSHLPFPQVNCDRRHVCHLACERAGRRRLERAVGANPIEHRTYRHQDIRDFRTQLRGYLRRI
jgi:hypothetical protein